jgi:hypothetical protein
LVFVEFLHLGDWWHVIVRNSTSCHVR